VCTYGPVPEVDEPLAWQRVWLQLGLERLIHRPN
jgi:hypothetical protein